MYARKETTGKKAVRKETTERVMQTTLRMQALRMMIRRHSLVDLVPIADLADQQIAQQGRIAERDRSTLPALRAAAAEAERVCDAAVVAVKAARDAAATPRKRVGALVSKVVYGAGERIQVLMVTYPTYRYDVAVDGVVVHSVKATRNWRVERQGAIAEAVASV